MTVTEYAFEKGKHAWYEPITENLAQQFPKLEPAVGLFLVVMDNDSYQAGAIVSQRDVDNYLTLGMGPPIEESN